MHSPRRDGMAGACARAQSARKGGGVFGPSVSPARLTFARARRLIAPCQSFACRPIPTVGKSAAGAGTELP